jgi:flagellar hook assembly protein FlgD
VTLGITDESGTLVRTLEPLRAAGIQRVFWNLRNEKDVVVEPGEYTITLEGSSARQSRTAVVKPPLVLPRR